MCGRGRCSLPPDEIVRRTRVSFNQWRDRERYQPSYNVAPGFWIPVLRRSDANTILQSMKWGLVPSFASKGSSGQPVQRYKMINARSERVTESPVFRRLLKTKRCVVVMNGFYEWHRETSKKKQPYYIHVGEDNIVRFAALYDVWEDDKQEALYSVTIMTTYSSRRLRWMHDRMPVMLPDEETVNIWLDEKQEWTSVEQYLRPYDGDDVLYHPVTTKMGSVAFQEKESCLDIRKGGLDVFFAPKTKTVKRPPDEEESALSTPSSKKVKTEAKQDIKTEVSQAETKPEIKIEVKPDAEPSYSGMRIKEETAAITRSMSTKLSRKAEDAEEIDDALLRPKKVAKKVAKKERLLPKDDEEGQPSKRLRSASVSRTPPRRTSARLNRLKK